MKNKDIILKRLKQESGQIGIPDSVKPERMRANLEEHLEWNREITLKENHPEMIKEKKTPFYLKTLAAVACICLVLGGVALAGQLTSLVESGEESVQADMQGNAEEQEKAIQNIESQESESIEYPKITYEEIYASMNEVWQEQNSWRTSGAGLGAIAEGSEMEEFAANDSVAEVPALESAASDVAYGKTNVQTVGVDEGDIVKNDGRYLYQIVATGEGWPEQQAIQIVDTKEGLKEVARIEDFESIVEFYVWEDVLVAIENKYLNNYQTTENTGMVACYDVAYHENYYHEITFYDLVNRSQPKKVKTFTLQGRYTSSRIADGYFYGFSRYYASPGEGATDYDAYVPTLDGARLEASRIFLPEKSKGTAYLVLVSMDLRNPMDFVQTTGIVSDSEMYYVSGSNIYVTDTQNGDGEEGWCSDKTALMRFSYKDGKFALQAEGEIKGSLNDTFSMDEYENHLRVVTTVREYKVEEMTDDRTGEVIGSATVDERQTNALYVLDEDLNLTGKIEGLAENEQIYSARFMGGTGYFVTFRQTDPLFAVDLTDPENPKVLSELKVSGFSEYLHIYGENRLFGLGMEADEETGMQEGMKLSMFDISNPADVREVTRLPLSEYNYSEALYNHHAVLINPSVNLIGFEAEGSDSGEYWKGYLVFSYENDTFVRKLKLDVKDTEGKYYTSRGTFIGDMFYLLRGDGSIKSYDLNTGEQLESLDL